MTTDTTDRSFKWAVPESLKVPPDPLRCRLDFHYQAVTLTFFEGDGVETKIVSARDVAAALASELAFSTGLLPPGTLWWQNTAAGPLSALYLEPKLHKVALLEDATQPPRRFNLPLPGLIFLCSPGRAPWVYAVKKKPTKQTDPVYRAPLLNIHANGHSCQGSHQYPERVADVPQSFFVSFFSRGADIQGRSLMYPKDVLRLWEHLDGKKEFPLADLVQHGTVSDLMAMEK